jgi:hypothetical protein
MVTSMVTPDASPAPLLWAAATDALWVASSGGNFVGTIELIEDRYVALDGTGAPLGVNGSLAGAKERVAAHFELAPIAPVRRFGAVTRRMRRRRRADLVA